MRHVLDGFLIPWSILPTWGYIALTLGLVLNFINFGFSSKKEHINLSWAMRGFILTFFIWHIFTPFKTKNYEVKVIPFYDGKSTLNHLVISRDDKTIVYECKGKNIGKCFDDFQENNKLE